MHAEFLYGILERILGRPRCCTWEIRCKKWVIGVGSIKLPQDTVSWGFLFARLRTIVFRKRVRNFTVILLSVRF